MNRESAVSTPSARVNCYVKAAQDYESRRGVIDELTADLEQHPHSPHLWRALGRIAWSSDPARAEVALDKAAELFAKRHEWLQSVQTRIIRLAMLERRQLHSECEQELRRLVPAIDQRKDETACALAISTIVDYQIRNALPLTNKAYLLERLSKDQLTFLSPEVALEVLRARIAMGHNRLNFERVYADIELLSTLAENSGNQRLRREAQVQRAHNDYFKSTLYPSISNIETSIESSRSICALSSKERGNLEQYFCRIYAEIGNRSPNEAETVATVVEECLANAKRLKEPTSNAECYRLISQTQASAHPARSFQTAIEAIRSVQELNAPSNVRISAWERFMRVCWEQRPFDEALAIARAALLEIEFLRESRNDNRLKLGSLALWTSTYRWLSTRLIETQEAPEALEQAFLVQERRRSRALLDELNANNHEARTDSLTSQRLELQEEILTWADATVGQPPNANISLDKVRSRLHRLEHLAAVHEQFSTLGNIQALLSEEQAMISFQAGVDLSHDGEKIGGTWAMVITSNAVTTVRLRKDRLTLDRAVRSLAGAMRKHPDSVQSTVDKLDQWLMQPLKEAIPSGVRHLILIPDGPLYKVPFFALQPRYSYSIVPSASIWAKLKKTQYTPEQARSFVVVDPARESPSMNNQRDRWRSAIPEQTAKSLSVRLRSSLQELESIKKHLGQDVVSLHGQNASEANVSARLDEDRNLVHISAHSLVSVDTGTPTAIALSNTHSLDMGLLTTEEIQRLPVKNAVVVLGGCETGAGEAVEGEGLLSIARAFQEAGARTVLASLWPLRDDLAAKFFDRFYSELGTGRAVAQALARTQRALKEEGQLFQSYAPFVVLGDGAISFEPQKTVHGFRSTLAVWLVRFTAFALLVVFAGVYLRKRSIE